MNSHRFILEPYKGKPTRHSCPNCGAKKAFVRYLDTETRQHISHLVGRCNRENNCGYHYTPKHFFEENLIQSDGDIQQKQHNEIKPTNSTRSSSLIPVDLFKESLQGHEKNCFIHYLVGLFGAEITSQLIGRYFIGSSCHWKGATVFWQIDTSGRIRTGKIILYNHETGKRVKEPYSHLTWAHSVLNLPDYNLKQCLFGEHLLNKEPDKPVAIVESEKTAIMASVYMPQFLWLATGGLSNFKIERCRVLEGRLVVLYPDLGGFEKWSEKAQELQGRVSVTVSRVLEENATEAERKEGLDIADYLVRFPLSRGKQQESIEKYTPVAECEQEFYKYTFEELQELLGAEEALKRVNQYKKLSRQFKRYENFIVHNCPLLISYDSLSYVKQYA